MKKTLLYIMLFAMAICCCACGKKKNKIKLATDTDASKATSTDATEAQVSLDKDEDGFYIERSYVTVTADLANVLITPDPSSPIFRYLSQGEMVETNGFNDKYYRINIEATNFYISKDQVSVMENSFGDGESGSTLAKKIVIDPCNQLVANTSQEPLGPNSNQTKPGASAGSVGGLYGTRESQINLDYAVALRAELQSRGYQVLLTRDSEEADITNKQRAEMANASGATVWIRLGVCESLDSEMSGIMAQCISERNSYHSELYRDSHALATRVLQGITDNIDVTNHGIYENDQMVAFNWSEIPVISIDIGFMSNATDEANLVTDWYKETMVKGIADGLDYYFQ